MLRNALLREGMVRTLWGCADLLQIIQGGLIQLASKAVTKDEPAWVSMIDHYCKADKTW